MAKNIALAVLALAVLAGGVIYFLYRRPQPSAIDLGIPAYPGATPVDSGSFAARLSPRDRARLIKAVIYETADPPDKVIKFYKEKLTGKAQVLERTSHGVPAAVIRTEIDGQPKLIVVTANQDTNKTEITISNVAQEATPQPERQP